MTSRAPPLSVVACAHPGRPPEDPSAPPARDAITPPYGTLIRFAAYTGLRAGEIGAVRVKRIDFRRGRVEVAESVSDVAGQLIVGPTKTYANRHVPMPPDCWTSWRPTWGHDATTGRNSSSPARRVGPSGTATSTAASSGRPSGLRAYRKG